MIASRHLSEPSPRPSEPAQPYHHGNLRSALLARAEVSLGEIGADGLSLRQLARDLGVSHGAPARHFRDKQALLDELSLEGFRTMNAALSVAAATPGSTRERLAALAHAYLAFALGHPDLLQLMYTTKHHETASAELRAIGEAGMLLTRDLIAEAQHAGEIAPADRDLLALVAFSNVHGIAVLATGDMLGCVLPADAVTATMDLLWAGLRSRSEPE